MRRKGWIGFILAGLLGWAAAPAVAGDAVLMGISEGVAEQASFAEMQEKYRPLADHLARVLKRKVLLESSQNIPSALQNLSKGRYDLLFARPSNVLGQGIRDHRYQLVAMAKGALTADFIVRRDAGMKKPEDVLGRSIAMPEPSSLVALAALATLRDLGAKPASLQVRHARYQEAVPFMVEQGFADVGAVAPGQSKAWEKKGGVVLFRSRKLPHWGIIASPAMSAQDVSALRDALIAMEGSEEGKAILARIGVSGWVAGSAQDYVEMMTWLGQ